MLRIALTGGIASGKTTVSDAFAGLGVPVIDADINARAVVEPGTPALQALVGLFGTAILEDNGELDRKALRQIVFRDEQARKQLEAVLHPAIRSLSEQQSHDFAAAGHPYLIHAIPLLLETGQAGDFDRVIVVDVPVELQIERVMQRDNCDRPHAEAIIRSQASREQRLQAATDVITNHGSTDDLRAQVMALHSKILALATAAH
ncbi:dephospho-CoA kinase [Granulosicoccaceae sp. 1_MG-2023]|nr:dephospho-CoA kinase [Granulosicoccaceae sp. 1_MG-2023]